MEVDRSDPNIVVRRMPGVIRTSNVAAPGEIPLNWNPFNVGANTADEFVLSSTGTIQDLVELQGTLMVYTDTSIHSIQQTGSPVIPFQISPVTFNYGANNTGSVLEVDGKHIVVGSNDVYVFGGHPGSIQSIADSRVRYQSFFEMADIQITRFSKYDELWFWAPATGALEKIMYIWNYRDNTWTIREQTTPLTGNAGHAGPVFVEKILTPIPRGVSVYTVDSDNYTRVDSASLVSYAERRRLALTPEFDTENLASIALLITGNGMMNIEVVGTNIPAEDTVDTSDAGDKLFNIEREYKQDIRVHGRFLNYRMTHQAADTDNGFALAGFQFDIGKGGTR